MNNWFIDAKACEYEETSIEFAKSSIAPKSTVGKAFSAFFSSFAESLKDPLSKLLYGTEGLIEFSRRFPSLSRELSKSSVVISVIVKLLT